MDYGTYKNNLSVVLTQACTDTDTVLHIDNAGTIPVLNEHGLYLTFVDTNEIVEVTSVDTTNNTITVVRGLTSFGGSSASSHNSGTKLSARVIAEHFDNLENNIENNETTINSHINNTSNPHNVTTSQIGALSNASDSLSIYFAKNHRFIVVPSYSADGWIENVSGTALVNYNPIWISTGTTANSYANVHSGTYLKNIPSSSMVSFFLMATSSLTNTNIYIGVTDSTNKIDGTQNFVGFHVNDGKVYAMCSNGSNTTEIDTGDTFINIYNGLMGSFYSTGSGVDFYNTDSILKAHITTNLPLSLYNGRFVVQIENLDATDRSILLYKIFAID